MSAVIVVLKSPYFAVSEKNGAVEIANVPAGSYRLHVFHERATEQTLAALTRTDRSDRAAPDASGDLGVGKRLSSTAAQEQIWERLSARDRFGRLCEDQTVTFSRLSLLWKILIPTSLVMTVVFAITGWLVQRSVVSTTYASVEQEAKASFQAYESLWKARADRLASVSQILSTSDVIRARVRHRRSGHHPRHGRRTVVQGVDEDAFFLVSDAQGRVIASLGALAPFVPNDDLPMVRAARAQFPQAGSGLRTEDDELFRWW